MAFGDTGRRIKAVRTTFRGVGMKQIDLARAIGASHSRVSQWESGKHEPPPAFVTKIAATLGVSPKYLLSGGSDGAGVPEVGSPLFPVSFPMIEIRYGGYVPAGDWTDPMESEDFIEVDARFEARGRFACRIEGDSMYPLLLPEDVAVFQTYGDRRPKIGHVILARRTDDNFVTVKQLAHDGGTFILRALNGSHEDAMAPRWEAVGYLVGFVRTLGSRTRSDYDPDGIRVDQAT